MSAAPCRMFRVNALRARLLGRALLRLKPSRMSESKGHCERYAVPYVLGQRPAGAFAWRGCGTPAEW